MVDARLVARIAAVAAVGLGYVLLSHWLMTRYESSSWSVVVILCPMLLIVAGGAWGSGYRWLTLAAAAGVTGLVGQALLGVRIPTHQLYLMQHIGYNAFLGVVFGSTLRPGHTSLITTLALKVHQRPLSLDHLAYTRKVTWAWTLFFAGLVALSLALYGLASFETWAVFANLVTPVATGAMFAGEYLIRYRLHPEFDRSSVIDAIRAYMQTSKAPAASSQRTPSP